MIGTLIMEALCVAGVLFMVRFLVALFKEDKPKSLSRVVYLSSWPTQSEHGELHLAGGPGARSERSDTRRPNRFQVIVGGANPPVRRVG